MKDVYRFDTNVRFCNTQKKTGELETLGLHFQLACLNNAGVSVKILLSFASSVPTDRPEDSKRSSFCTICRFSARLLASLLAGPEYKELPLLCLGPAWTLRIAVRLRAIDVPEPEWRPAVGDGKSDCIPIVTH